MASFPGSVAALANPTPTTKTGTATANLKHATQHSNINDEAEAIETKLGISEASAADTPVANTVLASLTATKSKWMAATTDMLAAGAVTQRGSVGPTASSPTTTSTSYVTLDSMSVTLTTVGGDLLVWLHSDLQSDAAGATVFLAIRLDAAAEATECVLNAPVGNYSCPISIFRRFTSVAAGSHTIDARWKVGSNTGTAGGQRRFMMVQEQKR